MSRRARTFLGRPSGPSRGRGAGPARARSGRPGRGGPGRGGPGRGGPGRGPRRGGRSYRRRSCFFCETKEPIDYKNTQILRRFTGDTGRIESRRKTSTCAKHQRQLATAIKRARYLALLPFVVRRRLHGTT